MNILLALLIVFLTPQENLGLNQNQEIQEKNEYEAVQTLKTKRYATHINSLIRNFDFFNNDGMYFVTKIQLHSIKCEWRI